MAPSELQLEQWPVDRLIDYARNPRKNDHAVEQMAVIITEFRFRIPVVAGAAGRLSMVISGSRRRADWA